MPEQTIIYLIMITSGLFLAVIVAYLLLNRHANKTENRYIRQLREGTEEKKFSSDVMYQKMYLFFLKIPFIKRYTLKLRRRLEIINIDDEYLTRKQTAKIIFRALLVIIHTTCI
jgi:hypothetical protein